MKSEVKAKLHEAISNINLMKAMEILNNTKPAPFIPFYEVMTYKQIAEYFGVTERRMKNVFNTHREVFANDCTMLRRSALEEIACIKVDLGVHYGFDMTFPNDVVANIAYIGNLVCNARAVLRAALYLYEETLIARGVVNTLKRLSEDASFSKSIVPLKAWFAKQVEFPESPAEVSAPDPVPEEKASTVEAPAEEQPGGDIRVRLKITREAVST